MKHIKSILNLLLVIVIALGVRPETSAAVSDTGFSDVSADAWYAESVKYCAKNGLMSGTAENIFSPDLTMSRAMLVTVLYRMAGSPQITGASNFSDVVIGAWYTDAVTWAVHNGIVSGYGSGLFGANDPVTYEQILTILWRYSRMLGRAVSEANDQPGSPVVSEAALTSSGAEAISAYAVGAVNWAKNVGVIDDNNDSFFSPRENATRAGVATILRNYLSSEQSASESAPVPELTSGSPPTPALEPVSTPEPVPTSESGMTSINITVGNSTFSAKLYNNDTTRAFLEQLPMTLNMSELNGNEKYYYLPNRLPTASEQVGSIKNGDLMLYGSDCLVLFYKSFSTFYSYTRIGTIDNPSGLSAALGSGGTEVTFDIGD